MRQVLTIAGSDPSGGAGVQADLKAIHANGAYGLSVITAITAQNTVGVRSVFEVPAEVVAGQLDAVFDDFEIAAVKIGMLGSREMVETVAAKLKQRRARNVVVDPVMVSSSGTRLLDHDAVESLKRDLFPLAAMVTPNVPEAEVLAGMEIRTVEEAEEAARRIRELGSAAVVVKGGHLSAAPGTDIFYDGSFVHLVVEDVPDRDVHGTGCTYAATIAAYLARDYDPWVAARRAQSSVACLIENAMPLGHGQQLLNHFPSVTEEFDRGGVPIGVHFVTDRKRCAGRDLESVVERAVAGGVAAVHVREPDLSTAELYKLTARLKLIAYRPPAWCAVIVNDRLDVALAALADGVQLGKRSLPLWETRRTARRRLLIGRSVHSLEEAVAAERGTADYLLVGTLYATRSHPDAVPAGPELVRRVREAVRLPIIGIGGINAGNADEVIRAGADGVAVVSAISEAEDVEGAARRLVEVVAANVKAQADRE